MNEALKLLSWHVEQARMQQRAGDFIKRSKNSIRLCGKTVSTVVGCDKNKTHEIIDIENEFGTMRYDGDAVIEDDVFATSENVVWDGDTIRFNVDGMLLTADQYSYLQKNGPLPQYSYFGKSGNRDRALPRVWREISRRAMEAKRDKSKEILYLSFGSITWTKEEATATQGAERVTSPLLFCPIVPVMNSKDRPRFTVPAEYVKANGILQRELKMKNIDIFSGVSSDIRFGQPVVEALAAIKERASEYPDLEVDAEDLCISILDSTNESICQMIEKNREKLAEAPLIKLFAGEINYSDVPVRPVTAHPIYPLLADDSQREVIESVCSGHSTYVAAAAGTGKSQTMVNIAANLCLHGKKLLVMSEKAAANKVFIKFARDIGLERFCLELDSKITVPQIVDQLDRIVHQSRVYLDPIRARDLLNEMGEIESWFENYQQTLYEEIAGMDMTLYELIGIAISKPPISDASGLRVEPNGFRMACRRLDDLQRDLCSTVTEEELSSYLNQGSTGDEELDEILSESIDALSAVGVNLIDFIGANEIPLKELAATAKATMARGLAERVMKGNNLGSVGNQVLRNKYIKLTANSAAMRSLYAGYLQQQLGKQIAEAVKADKELISLLERIKTSKMSVLDFFNRYGEAVLKLCPIIVTTPAAAVNYVTDKMNTFDAVLLDEASQVPIISVLPFLVGERQLIACGDQNQLDITGFFHTNRNDDYNEDGEYDISRRDKSILHLVQGKGIPSKRLLYHYRSKTQHLVTVSNTLCYNGMLNVVPDVYTGWDKLPPHLGFELCRVDVPFDPAEAEASAVKKRNGSKSSTDNPYLERRIQKVEDDMASAIAERVAKIRSETPEKTVGVITLNDAFHDKVLDAMEHLGIDTFATVEGRGEEAVWCRSLENTQGEESDIAIIAIEHDRRNVKGVLTKNISGFFNGGEQTEQSGNNRLNVLFTRAREKNIIFIPFDYREIRESERSLKRLYTYLEYAATGNMTCVQEKINTVDALNEHAAGVVAEAIGGGEVRRKVGDGMMMVDIAAMKDASAPRFDAGFLFPDRRLSTNTLCTRINLLERAGWKVLPLSPVYLMEKPQVFRAQLPKLLANDTKLGCTENENFLVSAMPTVPVSLEEITERGKFTQNMGAEEAVPAEPEIGRLTVADLSALDLEGICRRACTEPVRSGDQAFIDAKYKRNKQALLVKLAQKVHTIANDGDMARLESFCHKTYQLYSVHGEARACYLLAQILRTLPDKNGEGDRKLIRDLLDQAMEMKIIEEVK